MIRTAPSSESMVPKLRIYLLGAPRVEWLGQPWVIPRRQTRALLFRLAAELYPVSREHLEFLFWPDTPEAVARRHFTRLLTHLRRALPATDLVVANDDAIQLDPTCVWSDVAEFIRTGGAAGEAERAVALYRGPFLDGFSLPECPEFETWSLQERGTSERRYLTVLESVIEDRAAAGAYGEAITAAQRYLATDALAEQIYRRLIELYGLIGDRGAVQRQYEWCATVLERELGVSPLPETRAAYEVAMQGHNPEGMPAATVMPAVLPSLRAPLVGRDETLEQLGQAYTRARAGRGVAILLSGEAGVGKSRLAQEFLAHLPGRSVIAVGAGHEAERDLPYWPLIEALRPHVTGIVQAIGDDSAGYLAEAARLLPEIRSACPNLPPASSAEPGQEQGQLLAALTHCVSRWAAACSPLVLCLDDLHWADEATLVWLGYLGRCISSIPILILGSYRIEEADRLAVLRDGWARAGSLREVALQNLTPAEALYLIRQLSGQTTGAEQFSQRLYVASGGNPFFLLEIVRGLFETGVLRQDESGWSTDVDETTDDYRELPLPAGLSQIIEERMRRLTPQAYQVLEAAAVIGPRFTFALAQQISGRRETETVDALEELIARHVIASETDIYRFNHDLLRTVVSRDLSYGRRRLLHRRAAEALLRFTPNDAAALSRHFEGAEDWRRAAEYALRAAQVAKALFAYAEVRSQCDRALVFLDRAATQVRTSQEIAANRQLRGQALRERGWVLRLLGEMEAYGRDSAELARLAELSGDQRASAEARWREAHAQLWFCRYREALAAAEAGVQLSRAAGDPVLEAFCLRDLGLAHRELGQCGPARLALEQALSLFTATGEVEYEIHVLGNLSTLHLHCGDPALALALGQRSVARCEEANLPLARRLALGDLGAAAAALGDHESAQAWLEESLVIARHTADRTQEILDLGHLGWLAVARMRPAEALEFLEGALALAEAIDSRGEQSWLHAGLAEAHSLIGASEPARAHARQALALALAHARAQDEQLARQILNRLTMT